MRHEIEMTEQTTSTRTMTERADLTPTARSPLHRHHPLGGTADTQYEQRHEKRSERQAPTMNTIAQLPEPDVEVRAPVIRTAGPRCADGNGTLTPLFFSDDLVDIGRAKAICNRCQLRDNCLADAVRREEPWGVWGGELLLNGRIVTSKRACGRPPKHPRPALVVDELGVVPVESVA
jgi:WhiB family redox-sensing transcriptional regulator